MMKQFDNSASAEIATDPDKPWFGSFLRARRRADTGDVLVRERYLIFVSLSDEVQGWRKHLELHRVVTGGEQVTTTPEGSTYGRWGANIDEIVNHDLFLGDLAWAEQLREQINKGISSEEAESQISDSTLDEIVFLARAFGKNAFSSPGEHGRINSIIYPTICRANHSCAPNAVLTPCENPEESKLVAMRPIETWEPIQICYLPSEHLIRPIAVRRTALKQEWDFLCQCDRCESEVDDVRIFTANCSCGGHRFFVGPGNTLQCSSCKEKVPAAGDGADAAENQLLIDEQTLEQALASLPQPEDLELPEPDTLSMLEPTVLKRLSEFSKLHQEHRLAAEFHRRHVAMLHLQAKDTEAAAAQSFFVQAVQSLVPRKIRGLAWLIHLNCRLAYLLDLAGEQTKAFEALNHLLDDMALVSGVRPPIQMLAGMMGDPAWWRLVAKAQSAMAA